MLSSGQALGAAEVGGEGTTGDRRSHLDSPRLLLLEEATHLDRLAVALSQRLHAKVSISCPAPTRRPLHEPPRAQTPHWLDGKSVWRVWESTVAQEEISSAQPSRAF
ncbi:hypothetical protein NN561_015357 [Cricetulus griseus]